MRARASITHLAGAGLLAGTLTLGLAFTGVSSSGASVKSHASGDVRIALTATKVRWIFPFVPSYRFTVTNVSTFEQPMYRPCYWFGLGSSIAPQPALSICQTPKWTGSTKVVINLNHYVWSGGHGNVTAKDFMFFMNMYKSHPFDYGGYFPAFGIPDQVKNASATGPEQVTITLKSPANKIWFLYNALAEITPMPRAWDIQHTGGAAGSGGCEDATWASIGSGGHDTGPCNKVWTYLANDPAITGNPGAVGQASNRGTYATNPLWQIVDGPYHMTSFDDTLHQWSLAPNPTYSGPQASGVATIEFKYYSSLTSEEAALEGGQLDIGNVAPTDVTAAPHPGVAGTNKLSSLSGFNVRTGAFWGFDYAYFNFNSTSGGSNSKLVNSAAVRQALESGINQSAIINSPAIYNGYAVPDCSPLPYLGDTYVKHPVCPFPYNPTKAHSILVKAGWSGTTAPMTCNKTGGCQGVPKGTKLALTYFYPSGSTVQDTLLNVEKASWAGIGIKVTLDNSKDASAIASFCLSTSGTAPNGPWSICQYGGWVYSPGAYPSGEQFLLGGSASNSGEVNYGPLNTSITKSISTATGLSAYNQTAANYLPLLFQPSALGTGEGRKTLLGIQPPNPLSDFNPEYIHCAGACHS